MARHQGLSESASTSFTIRVDGQPLRGERLRIATSVNRLVSCLRCVAAGAWARCRSTVALGLPGVPALANAAHSAVLLGAQIDGLAFVAARRLQILRLGHGLRRIQAMCQQPRSGQVRSRNAYKPRRTLAVIDAIHSTEWVSLYCRAYM